MPEVEVPAQRERDEARDAVRAHWKKMRDLRLQKKDSNASMMDSDFWRPVVMGFVGGSLIGSTVGFGERVGFSRLAALRAVPGRLPPPTLAAEFLSNIRAHVGTGGGADAVASKLMRLCASRAFACSM